MACFRSLYHWFLILLSPFVWLDEYFLLKIDVFASIFYFAIYYDLSITGEFF